MKSVDKTVAIKGETLTYTSVVTNTGSLPLFNTIFRDAIPLGTSFVAGSVTVDGTSFPSYDPSAGFTIGTLNPSDSVTVIFQVEVN